MKNLVIALLIALVSTTTFAQKGKTATSSSSLASFENLKAEIISEGENKN